MLRVAPVVLAAAATLTLGACGSGPRDDTSAPVASTGTPTSAAAVLPTPDPTTASAPVTASLTASVTASPAPAGAHRETHPDPRWRFYSADHRWYTSAWFTGAHRIMIGFGCNASPWYDHDPRCPGTQGFHHGIDVAMPCGTPIRAGLAGTVLPSSAPGTPGPAYGIHPVRLRITGPDGPHDVVIGHAREVFVHPGEHVRLGERIALASDSGAPDGCHLHFEIRPPAGSYTAAVDPARWLALRPAPPS